MLFEKTLQSQFKLVNFSAHGALSYFECNHSLIYLEEIVTLSLTKANGTPEPADQRRSEARMRPKKQRKIRDSTHHREIRTPARHCDNRNWRRASRHESNDRIQLQVTSKYILMLSNSIVSQSN